MATTQKHTEFGTHVEGALEEIRAEMGNAGFAAQLGMTALAVDALEVAHERLTSLITFMRSQA